MKKKWFLIGVLAAAISVGSGITAMAAAGWTMENGKWFYYDNSGNAVTREWKKGADDQWRYLNSRGEMAADSWVEDTYYVDSDGLIVSNRWMKLGVSPNGGTSQEHWYYFLENGKAVKDAWKKLNNKWYHFDTDGQMETGWMDEEMSFANEDGAALIGWHKLYPPEGQEKSQDPFDNDGKNWYYFNSSGKKLVPELADGAEYGEKRVEGSFYCFDRNGAMQTGWVYVGSGGVDADSVEDYRFYNSTGKGVVGWYSAEPPRTLRGYQNDVEWFYFSKSGVPKCGPAQGTASVKDLVRIDNKTYLFNQRGTPVTGLQKVYVSDTEYTAYYFNKNTCTIETGKLTVDEGDGNKSQFYFSNGGKGFTGVQGGSLYYMGKLQMSQSGSKYEVISIPNGNRTYKNYLVNNSGKVIKSTSGVKDSSGVKYITDSNGILVKIDSEPIGSDANFREPEEPVWN